MKEFNGKNAVITGAATGIGRSFAKEAARRGMRLALIDIAVDELNAAAEECMKLGAPLVVAIPTDVSLYAEVKASIDTVMEKLGGIDLMFSNAGVWAAGGVTQPPQDWEWSVGVNVLGTSYYVHEVLKILDAQKTPCHYMITSSIAGLMTPGVGGGSYMASKHAVTAIAEEVKDYAANCGYDLGVSVFCPDVVATEIALSAQRRPERFTIADDPFYTTAKYKGTISWFDDHIRKGYNPDGIAVRLFRAIEDKQMYVLTHPYSHAWVKARLQAIEADMEKETAIYEELENLYKT